jgi:hypothetical protein
VKGDGTDFIFSLDNKIKYANIRPDHALWGHKDAVINFGGGDIFISDECTTNQNSHM